MATKITVRGRNKIRKYFENLRYYHIHFVGTRVFYLFLVILLVVIGFVYAYSDVLIFENFGAAGNSVSGRVITENDGSLGFYLAQSEIIRDLPKKSVIELEIDDEKFFLTREKVSTGYVGDPEIHIGVPGKYFDNVAEEGFCSILSRAWNSGDVEFYSSLSKTELLWKYKKMLKYKQCIAI